MIFIFINTKVKPPVCRTCPAGSWGGSSWTLWMCAAGVEMVGVPPPVFMVQCCSLLRKGDISPPRSISGAAGSGRPLRPAVLQGSPWKRRGGRRRREQRAPGSSFGVQDEQRQPSAHPLLDQISCSMYLKALFTLWVLFFI